jgi:outer membrane protein insertion porin family
LQIIDLEGHTTITSVGLDLRNDTTDSPILPSKGSSIGIGWEAVGALGGQYTFDKFTADAAFHQTLNVDLLDRKTTLTEKISGGYIDAYAPFFERFYAGGIGSIRGFRYRGISPRQGPDADPIGGNWSVSTTVELNFPILGDNLRGVVFTDAGEIENQLRIDRIRVSAGVGIRLQLPIFGQVPIGLDLGFPLVRYRDDNTQVISFSLGFAQ